MRKRCSAIAPFMATLGITTMTSELLIGLIGALLGAVASVGTILVQQHFQSRQERAKLILEAAIRQHQAAEEHAKFMAANNKGKIVQVKDLAYYVALYSLLIEQMDKPQAITEASWGAAYARAESLTRAAVRHFDAQEKSTKSDSTT